MSKPVVWACGGGRQSVAIAVLIDQAVLPKPDMIVMADTSREARETWEYKTAYLDPLLAKSGLAIEIAPHSLASADIWNGEGSMLMPAFTAEGKLPTYCSGYWKRDICERYCASKGIGDYTQWLGMSFDESNRATSQGHGRATNAFPLIDLRLTASACVRLVEAAGLPRPPKSSCFMCPHRGDDQWLRLKDKYPDEFEAACKIDEQIRDVDQANGQPGVWLHKSRMPLRLATFVSEDERNPLFRPCESGYCFV